MTQQISIENLIQQLAEIKNRDVIAAARSAIDQSTTEFMRLTRDDINNQLRPVGTPIPSRLLRARYKRTRTTSTNLTGSVSIGTLPFNPIRFPGIRDTGRTRRGKRGRVGRGVVARGGFQLDESFIAKAPNSGKNLVWTRESAQRFPIRVERIDIHSQVESSEASAKTQIENVVLPQKFEQELQKRLAKYR